MQNSLHRIENNEVEWVYKSCVKREDKEDEPKWWIFSIDKHESMMMLKVFIKNALQERFNDLILKVFYFQSLL